MKKIAAVVFVIAAVMAAGPIQAKELTVSGSTTVEQRIMKPAVAAIESATGIKVRVLGTGSGAGFKDLMAGKVPASMTSEPLSMLLKKHGLPDDGTYQEHILTKDVIVPVVNKGNAVAKLTWEQLSDINTGKIVNWKDVGGADQKIIVVTAPPTDGTRAFFQSTVMKKADFVKGVQTVRAPRDIIELVSKLKGGVGYASQGLVAMSSGRVKEVQTADISRALSIITKGKPNAEVKAVIDFLKTPKAVKLFK